MKFTDTSIGSLTVPLGSQVIGEILRGDMDMYQKIWKMFLNLVTIDGLVNLIVKLYLL